MLTATCSRQNDHGKMFTAKCWQRCQVQRVQAKCSRHNPYGQGPPLPWHPFRMCCISSKYYAVYLKWLFGVPVLALHLGDEFSFRHLLSICPPRVDSSKGCFPTNTKEHGTNKKCLVHGTHQKQHLKCKGCFLYHLGHYQHFGHDGWSFGKCQCLIYIYIYIWLSYSQISKQPHRQMTLDGLGFTQLLRYIVSTTTQQPSAIPSFSLHVNKATCALVFAPTACSDRCHAVITGACVALWTTKAEELLYLLA